MNQKTIVITQDSCNDEMAYRTAAEQYDDQHWDKHGEKPYKIRVDCIKKFLITTDFHKQREWEYTFLCDSL